MLLGVKEKFNKEHLKYYVVAILSIVLFIRNYYSFCWSDESYYLANTYRVFQGDVINYNMWDITGYFAYPLLIPFSIYKFFFGTQGIYLFFRHIQVALFTLLGFKVLDSFKYYKNYISVPCAIGLMIYSRANIMGCSYYNTGYVLNSLAALFLYDILFYNRYNKNYQVIIVGFIAGVAIITNPYIVFPAIILFVIACIKDFKTSLFLLPGVAVVASAFFVKYFSSSYITSILQIASDNYWQNYFSAKSIYDFFNNIYTIIPKTVWIIQSIVFVVLLVKSLIMKQELNKKVLLFFLFTDILCFLFASHKMIFWKTI